MNDKIRKEQIKEILRQSIIRDVKFEDAIESIVCRINDAVEEKERALRQLEEWNKDEELAKVREELKISEYVSGFLTKWNKVSFMGFCL